MRKRCERGVNEVFAQQAPKDGMAARPCGGRRTWLDIRGWIGSGVQWQRLFDGGEALLFNITRVDCRLPIADCRLSPRIHSNSSTTPPPGLSLTALPLHSLELWLPTKG